MKEYLQLARAQTVPLEAVPAALGAALAVGEFQHLSVIAWTIFGVMYHLTGYSHNSVADWESGHDKDDPNKAHHPLNSGELSWIEAEYVVKILAVLTTVYVMYLIYPSPIGYVVMIVGVMFGFAYNRFGKYTKYKFALISVAHTSVFVMPYVSLGGNLTDPVFLLGVLFMYFWVAFQIGYSGEVKDIMRDEENYLLSRGVETDEQSVFYTDSIRFEALSVKALTGCVGFIIVLILGGGLWDMSLMITLASFAVLESWYMLCGGMHRREEDIRSMSQIEAYTLMMFIVAFSPMIGGKESLALILISVAWVVVMNRCLWGSYLSPKV